VAVGVGVVGVDAGGGAGRSHHLLTSRSLMRLGEVLPDKLVRPPTTRTRPEAKSSAVAIAGPRSQRKCQRKLSVDVAIRLKGVGLQHPADFVGLVIVSRVAQGALRFGKLRSHAGSNLGREAC
jgi:hypothetical protein